jgi:hypothetical protein
MTTVSWGGRLWALKWAMSGTLNGVRPTRLKLIS